MRNNRVNSELSVRKSRVSGAARRHKLPVCEDTGLARYRDRAQARHGAKAHLAGGQMHKVSTFACPGCRGYHLEVAHVQKRITVEPTPEPNGVFASTLALRKRRYFLIDIENATFGAGVASEQVAHLWHVLKQQAPGIAPHDHVVVGAARSVVRKYRTAINDPNVKWVVGADAPDGADRALMAAINLHRVARDYDELVIVSGDHAFAALARDAKKSGLSVHVITTQHPEQRSMLSRELSRAADTRTLVRLTPRPRVSGAEYPITSTLGRPHRVAHLQPVAA